MSDIIWKERKRWVLFALPFTLTKYSLSEESLYIQTGLLNLNEDEVKLYRITDLTLKRSFFQRIFGLGTIKCCSADKTLGDFDIKNIKSSNCIKKLISECVEKERDRKRVGSREFFNDDYND
jgi:hypothetical protein